MMILSVINLIKYPILTEKTIRLIEQNQYSFAVDKKASKIAIKAAIEKLFEVKVLSVRTALQPIKKKRIGKFMGQKARHKRAIIKLAPENSINLFDED
jgi:large subunit ribosomal protein L23